MYLRMPQSPLFHITNTSSTSLIYISYWPLWALPLQPLRVFSMPEILNLFLGSFENMMKALDSFPRIMFTGAHIYCNCTGSQTTWWLRLFRSCVYRESYERLIQSRQQIKNSYSKPCFRRKGNNTHRNILVPMYDIGCLKIHTTLGSL